MKLINVRVGGSNATAASFFHFLMSLQHNFRIVFLLGTFLRSNLRSEKHGIDSKVDANGFIITANK